MEAGGPNPELDAKLVRVVAALRYYDPMEMDGGAADLIAAVELARVIVANVVTPGWFCDACKIFTGDGRFHLTECRSCGGPR